LHDRRREFQEARRLLASYHDRFGDEITFIPGGYFAPMYDTREHNRQTIHKALDQISEMVGNGYRPQSLVAGSMDAENQRLLAADEGIHVCQGQIWSQHGIDHGDRDGGICYPYYPSREHYLKPARVRKILLTVFAWTDGPATFWQLGGKDFKAVSIAGWAWDRSRPWGTSEPIAGRKEMLDTTAVHFDRGHAMNKFGWVTAIWEVSIGHDEDLTYWLHAVQDRWPDTQVKTEGAWSGGSIPRTMGGSTTVSMLKGPGHQVRKMSWKSSGS
jgi:Domain of Unknown Function with PDB structure (DUF3863)